ncbi:MAG: DUF4221 family protein [Bacteroidales bacterium]|jgi:hypothetical protein
MKKITILIICLLFLASNHAQEAKVKYRIEKDSVNCSFSFKNLKAWGFYECNKGIFLFTKLSYSDTINIFKEESNGFNLYKVVKLPKAYMDTIGSEIESDRFQITFVDLNTIVIVTRYSLAMIDIKNNKLSKYFYQSYDSYALVDRFGAIRWNKSRNKLPLMLVRFDDYNSQKWDWDSELLAEFDFKTGKINILPIRYPFVEQYLSKYTNYSYVDPLITFNKNKYVVAFGNNPIIFTYDVKTKKSDSLYVENVNYKPITIITDTNVKHDFDLYQDYIMASYTNDFFYTEMVYDEYNHVYYRFFYKDMPKYDEDSLLNTFDKKDVGLSVLDENFKIIGDIIWKTKGGGYSSFWYPTSNGLYGISFGCIGGACKKNHIMVLKLKLEYEK